MKAKLKLKTIKLTNSSSPVLLTAITGGGNEGCCTQACTHWCWSERCGSQICFHFEKI